MPFLVAVMLLSVPSLINSSKLQAEHQLKKKPTQKVLIVNQNSQESSVFDIDKKSKRAGAKKVSRRLLFGKNNSSLSLDSMNPSLTEYGDANHDSSNDDDEDSNKNLINTPISMRPPHKISPLNKLEAGIQRTQSVLLVKKKRK